MLYSRSSVDILAAPEIARQPPKRGAASNTQNEPVKGRSPLRWELKLSKRQTLVKLAGTSAQSDGITHYVRVQKTTVF